MAELRSIFQIYRSSFPYEFSELHTLPYERSMIDKNYINAYNSSFAQYFTSCTFSESSIYLPSYKITNYSPLVQTFRKFNLNTRLQENIDLQK